MGKEEKKPPVEVKLVKEEEKSEEFEDAPEYQKIEITEEDIEEIEIE